MSEAELEANAIEGAARGVVVAFESGIELLIDTELVAELTSQPEGAEPQPCVHAPKPPALVQRQGNGALPTRQGAHVVGTVGAPGVVIPSATGREHQQADTLTCGPADIPGVEVRIGLDLVSC